MSESNKETETLSTVDSLRGHIQDLTELANRLQSIRQIPTLLRGTGISRELPQFDTTSLRIGFQDLAELKDAIVSEKVQAALNLARECEKADGVGLSLNWRRGNQKRRCIVYVHACLMTLILRSDGQETPFASLSKAGLYLPQEVAVRIPATGVRRTSAECKRTTTVYT